MGALDREWAKGVGEGATIKMATTMGVLQSRWYSIFEMYDALFIRTD